MNRTRTIGITLGFLGGILVTQMWGGVGAGRVVGAGTDLLVLCSSCAIPSDKNHGYLIMLDRNTNAVLAYASGPLDVTKAPIALGTLQTSPLPK